MATAKTGTGPIVQVSVAADPDTAVDECTAADGNTIESINDGVKNIALTDGHAATGTSKNTGNAAAPKDTAQGRALTSNGIAGGPVTSSSKGNAKAPTFRITARNSFCKVPNTRAHARNYGKPSVKVTGSAATVSSGHNVVAQDLATASTGATARAGVALKVLKTETGHEVLNVGEYYYKINTIRWKCGFIENGCYYWLCMMNNKTLCQSIIKTTIINGRHRIVKDDKTHGTKAMKHNHVPLPHAEVLIALLRGD